ncbi:MAG TPA: nucleic acid-binding protein [Methanoregulaceae archaeon]|nr:nucleic acid-binding protein [Methanoregulaceae archaeon]HOH80978.1 nucleic acid-binding protein [Methanoregulaceae archaeon]HOW33463.1 nucleic acid-binding protein [Methanoregulaceae archaeon]HPW10427.1 nucleic acid-binding protein [Methanoregulaceae archaeon]HQM56482.1 nucleic acid-binding protein [Methanoregulaceae archaeon]
MAAPERPSFARREGTFEREPARRVFAGELRETRIHFREGEDEKSPTYVLLPTGERCNRVFLVGTLTEKKKQGEQNMFYRARVVDPTGTFFIMAGSYQPEAMQQIARIEPPAFVAVAGKPNVYETPDGATLISVRCESVTPVEKDTRDRWVLDCALSTLDRIDNMGTTKYGERARLEYHSDPAVFRKMVFEALSQLSL